MMHKTVLLAILITAVEAVKEIALVGNPLLRARPCDENDDVTATFEYGLPPGEENQYTLHAIGNLVPNSRVILKFDSDASVTVSDGKKARISADQRFGIFTVYFFKPSKSLNLRVKGPATGTIPYVQSIEQDGEEICTKPQTGYFDSYIQGVRDTAEVSLTVPEGSCGRRKVMHTELIVNGQPTKSGDWPWHVALFRVEGSYVKYICGGTLLSNTIVLTAAHCASIRGDPVIPNSLSIVLGKHNLIGGDIAPQEREVFEIIIHSEFKVKSLENDVAILKLKSEAIFDDYVQPACLWHTNNHKNLPSGDVYGTVVGWGFNHQDVLSTTLQQINIPIVSEATCLKSNPIFFSKKLSSNKFCAGYTNGTSACNGDSGGALLVFVPDTPGATGNASGTWHVRGIVSLSVSRLDAAICDPYQYTLFTDVSKYRDWIAGYLN